MLWTQVKNPFHPSLTCLTARRLHNNYTVTAGLDKVTLHVSVYGNKQHLVNSYDTIDAAQNAAETHDCTLTETQKKALDSLDALIALEAQKLALLRKQRLGLVQHFTKGQ
jgi:hypothetical protein